MENNYLGYEDKKALLSSYLKIVHREKEIMAEIQYLEERKRFPMVVLDGISEIHKADDYPEYKILIEYQIRLLKNERLKNIRCYTAIEDGIRKLKDENEQRVLRLIYLKGMKGEEVAEEMSYSIRRIRYIQKNAVEHLKIKTSA